VPGLTLGWVDDDAVLGFRKFSSLVWYVPCMMQYAVYQPPFYALKCEHDRYTISYMFQHFLSAIFREPLYWLKLGPFSSSVM